MDSRKSQKFVTIRACNSAVLSPKAHNPLTQQLLICSPGIPTSTLQGSKCGHTPSLGNCFPSTYSSCCNMFLAPKSHQNLLCKVFRNEVLKRCHPQHKLTPSRLSCDYLLLCFAGRNGWMLMLVLGKGIKRWSFGPGDSQRFNISGSRNYLFKLQYRLADPNYLVAPLQQDWTQPSSWTGDCSDAMAHGQQNSPLKEGLGQSRVQTSPENLPLHSQRSLCPGGHGGQGDGGHKRWHQGVFVVSHISQFSKQFLLISRIPLILTQKADLWFQICWGKLCVLTSLMYSQNQGSALLFWVIPGQFFPGEKIGRRARPWGTHLVSHS